MELKDVMSRDPATISADDTIAMASARMHAAGAGCLVVTVGRYVRGVLTDRDLSTPCDDPAHDTRQCKVACHMSTPVIAVEPDVELPDAVRLMAARSIKHLPVVEAGGQLVGLLSFSDIARALVASSATIAGA